MNIRLARLFKLSKSKQKRSICDCSILDLLSCHIVLYSVSPTSHWVSQIHHILCNIRNDFLVLPRPMQVSQCMLPLFPTLGAVSAKHIPTYSFCLNVPYLYAGHPLYSSITLCSHYYAVAILTYPSLLVHHLSICRLSLVHFYHLIFSSLCLSL